MEILAVALGVFLVVVGIALMLRSAKPSRRRESRTAGELAEARRLRVVARRRARRP